MIDSADLLARFLRYVQIDTRSDASSTTVPSTPGQWDLLRLLAAELTALGATEVTLTPAGFVLATVPATVPHLVPVMAWCAHVDTATNLPGGAKPLVHRAYAGQPIVLPEDPTQTLTLENSPKLRACLGHDLITASGTTLLGSDDKSGVATIVATARHLLLHPEIPHGKIRLCFSPDEEIATGMNHLDLAQLGAEVAYTLDGESPGEIDDETLHELERDLDLEELSALSAKA